MMTAGRHAVAFGIRADTAQFPNLETVAATRNALMTIDNGARPAVRNFLAVPNLSIGSGWWRPQLRMIWQ
jgi:hypothetical protein